MQISRLPADPLLWPDVLDSSPFWWLTPAGLHPQSEPYRGGWLVLFGKALSFGQLDLLAPLLVVHRVKASLYPPMLCGDIPVLLLSTSRFAPELVEEIKALEWDVDLCHLAHLPTLAEPGLLVMDMDSTAIRIECIDEMARLAGVGEEVAAVTAAAMRGELDFAESLRRRVALLAGAPASIIDEVAANIPLMPGLELMVATLQRSGWRIAIASGGFIHFAQRLQQALGLDAVQANQLEIADNRLTGRLVGQIVDADLKASTLEDLARQYAIPLANTVAVGDGANDLGMLATAGLGIALHAKPLVQKQAAATLNHHDLEGVICLLSARNCVEKRWGADHG